MKLNVGKIDRTLRIVVGGGLAIASAMGVIPAWGWLGLILVATGIVGLCPVYSIFKISTTDHS